MAVEGPADLRVVGLRQRLGDVVQHGRPAQPQVVAAPCHVVHDLERVVEVVLVGVLPAPLDPLQGVQLGEDQRQQAGQLEQFEPDRRDGREHDLVEFGGDALARDDADARGVAADRLEGLLLNPEAQLRGEAHGAHHAQRIVREGDVGIARRADDAVLEVLHAAEGVDQLAEGRGVERPRHGVDREVAAPLVVLERAGLDLRLARVVRVGFAARPDELNLGAVARADHRRAEGLEDRDLRVQLGGQRLGQLDAAADDHDVDVGRRAAQVVVADIPPDDEGPQPQRVGQAREPPEKRVRQGPVAI